MMIDPAAGNSTPISTTDRRLGPTRAALLVLILATSGALRSVDLGRASYWYDEVVTIRLAQTPNPAELIRLLGRIDATRAPLHPLLLQGWVRLLGPSERSSRALSLVCGFGTVAFLFLIGRRAFGVSTGLWASWLGALSPLLVQYSRETRMYAFLTLLTCLAWWLLLGFRRSSGLGVRCAFAATLIAMAYTHPLGLLMIATLAIGYLADRPRSTLRIGGWLTIQAVVFLAILPWIGRYFDHAPESTVGKLPIRFLLGLPIGYIGGNSQVLLACGFLVGIGLITTRRVIEANAPPSRTVHFDDLATSRLFLIWLAIPPITLYTYSLLDQPIFGPPRYMLFVGPAYLILLARGLTRLRWLAIPVALFLAFLSVWQLRETVFDPNGKADWRSAAKLIHGETGNYPVVVVSTSEGPNVEVETARFYLGPEVAILPVESAATGLAAIRPEPDFAWFAIGIRERRIAPYVPSSLAGSWRGREDWWLDGLKLELRERVDPVSHRAGPSSRRRGDR